jgi:hypothetical protein
MMQKITNEEIYKKLLEIEELLSKRAQHRKFDKISEWKIYIWDGCPHKAEKIENDEILYKCSLRNGSCEFSTCPRNWVK